MASEGEGTEGREWEGRGIKQNGLKEWSDGRGGKKQTGGGEEWRMEGCRGGFVVGFIVLSFCRSPQRQSAIYVYDYPNHYACSQRCSTL